MKKYINYLHDKRLSPETVKRYAQFTTFFIQWYGGDTINAQKKDVINYLTHLTNKGLQPKSRNLILNALRYYFDFLMSEDQATTNPTALLKMRGVKRRKLPHVLTPEELTEIVDNYYFLEVRQAEENMHTGINGKTDKKAYYACMRNYVMLQFFIYQGINTREIAELQTEDINLHRATVTIPKGTQRGNARTLPINAAQMGAIIHYLQHIRPQFTTDDGTMFLPSKHRKRRSTVKSVLFALSTELKRMDKRFTNFAALRASVITQWIKTHGLRKAQYMAGHKSIISTEDYLSNCIEDLAADITRFNPYTSARLLSGVEI